MGSRLPEQLAHDLCFLLHASEQVCELQPGQVYLGVLMWQMLHSVLSSGSAISAGRWIMALLRCLGIVVVTAYKYFREAIV